MSVWKNWTSATAVLCAAAICRGEEARIVFTHALPVLDGGRLEAKVVEVTYGPGEWSPAHSHPCPVIGYVIEGAGSFRQVVQQEYRKWILLSSPLGSSV